MQIKYETDIIENNIKNIVMLYGGRAETAIDDSNDLQLIESCYEIFYQAHVDKVLVASSAAIYAKNDTEVYSESVLKLFSQQQQKT